MKGSWRLVNISIGLALIVVLLGGWTRLNDAGLGCPDWPACYGHFVLPSAERVDAAITPHFPGYRVDLKKGWLEMIHRYAASTLGLLILVQTLLGWRQRKVKGYPVGLSFVLLGLVIVQGLFGMWTVTLKLVPWVVTLHLLGGLTTLALLVRLRQRLRRMREKESEKALQGVELAVVLLLVVLFGQLALGGWTSSNYAGWACDHWLVCHEGRAVDFDFEVGLNPMMPLGPNYEGGMLPASARAAIQVSHRAGAVIFMAALLMVSMKLWSRAELKPWLGLIWGITGLQIMLGALNVIWQLPLALAVAHHAVAVLLLLSVVALYDRARVRRTEVIHGYLSTG